MKTYVSHKRVKAAQITSVTPVRADPNASTSYLDLTLDGEPATYNVPPEMFARYSPIPGDFLVIYQDGYTSISPKDAFEQGYTEADL